jgi:hypothetical protein
MVYHWIVTRTYPKDRDDEHIKLSFKPLIHLLADALYLVFHRKSVIVDVDFRVEIAVV